MADNPNNAEPVRYSFINRPDAGQINQIVNLYRMAGWWADDVDDPSQIDRIVSGSHCFAIATIDDKIIGIGRAISDKISDAYIQDITVDESYRGQGIASRIIDELVKKLHEDGLYWIGLIAERGTQEFYKRLGFETMPNAAPMLRKDI